MAQIRKKNMNADSAFVLYIMIVRLFMYSLIGYLRPAKNIIMVCSSFICFFFCQMDTFLCKLKRYDIRWHWKVYGMLQNRAKQSRVIMWDTQYAETQMHTQYLDERRQFNWPKSAKRKKWEILKNAMIIIIIMRTSNGMAYTNTCLS